jgi:hypothetical protein
MVAMTRWLGIAALVAASACSCGQAASSTSTASSVATSATPGAGRALAPTTNVYAYTSGTTIGATATPLVSVPNVGILTGSCTDDGRFSARFVVAPKAPTASIVVTTSPGAQVRGTTTARSLTSPAGQATTASQTWQIAPISSGTIRVATINVSSQPAPAVFGGKGCVVAAQAVVTTRPR